MEVNKRWGKVRSGDRECMLECTRTMNEYLRQSLRNDTISDLIISKTLNTIQ